jgi:predicted  nucleic acid-binding Zn-ribbon protein
VAGHALIAARGGIKRYAVGEDAVTTKEWKPNDELTFALQALDKLNDENEQLKRDIEYLAAERVAEKKRAEKLEGQMKTMRTLYEAEANEADDLAHEISRLNAVIKEYEIHS